MRPTNIDSLRQNVGNTKGIHAFRTGLPLHRAKFVCEATVFERNSSAVRRRNFLETGNSSATWARHHTDLRRSLEELACAHDRQGLWRQPTSGNSSAVCPTENRPFCTTVHGRQHRQFTKHCVFHRQDGGGISHLMLFRFK